MSTVTLVILAILTAGAALAALALLRWREKQRLERAREIVRSSDLLIAINSTGEELAPWLSPMMLNFIASTIQKQHRQLQQLSAPPSRRSTKALENALLWQQGNKAEKRALPGDSKQAQQLRNSARNLLVYLREAYQQRLLGADEARTLLREAKVLTLNITLSVLEEKAGAAARLNNHYQAIHFLRKADELLSQQADLPPELAQIQADIRERLRHHEQERRQSSSGTRLEEGAALLSAEDDAWKKKKFD